MDDLRFDAAAVADLDALLALARAFHAEDGHALSQAGEGALATVACGEPLARCWLIRRVGVAVGYVVLTLGFSIEHGGREGFIDDLYLVPAARGIGIGPALLAFIVAEAEKLGIRMLHLEVEPGNERAQSLYRRNGFAESGRRLMSRRLASPEVAAGG
jgi:ribosomal protein S18 acetylase RimI-like enzyme